MGVSPYHRSNKKDTATRICAGERPSRPTNRSQYRWLRDPVWDVIVAGWNHKPVERCGVFDMYYVFSTSSEREREVQEVRRGNLNAWNGRDLALAETSQTPKQGNLGKSSRVSPLSSSFCKTLSQKYRGALMK